MTDPARCVVCLGQADTRHPDVGDLCARHDEALRAQQATGEQAHQVITRWRANIIAAALHHLDEQGPPPHGREER